MHARTCHANPTRKRHSWVDMHPRRTQPPGVTGCSGGPRPERRRRASCCPAGWSSSPTPPPSPPSPPYSNGCASAHCHVRGGQEPTLAVMTTSLTSHDCIASCCSCTAAHPCITRATVSSVDANVTSCFTSTSAAVRQDAAGGAELRAQQNVGHPYVPLRAGQAEAGLPPLPPGAPGSLTQQHM